MISARLIEGDPHLEPTRAPVLVDFCAARMARNPTGRLRDSWLRPPSETVAAVRVWRCARHLTVSEAAKAAGVSTGAWTRFEQQRLHTVERAFPALAILSWVMSQGGPAVDLGGET